MGELTDYLIQRYTKNHNSETKEIMNKQRVKNDIMRKCELYLKEAGDEFTFEVLPSELQYAVAVITEEPLRSQYIINQISNSLFIARLLELDL